jgi:adenylate cyclase
MINGPTVENDGSTAYHGLRRGMARLQRWLGSLHPTGRLRDSVDEAEQAGLSFAFRARTLAILVVGLYLVFVPWPRNAYYLALAACFFVLGYIPYRLRRHRFAVPIRLFFVVLDVGLIAVAILIPPPAGLALDWSVQSRLRGQEFLYLLLLLGEAALTYSALRVFWTGACIAVIWSIGFSIIYGLADTTRLVDLVRDGLSDEDVFSFTLGPTYVSLTQWLTQIVGTMLLTCLLVIAVLRSRMHLIAELRADTARSALSRYVSPDVADALNKDVGTSFGVPASRYVAVLFADVVGFTGMAESMSPEGAFALIRGFQERVTRVVFRHTGTLDKYLGDGLMVTFGALRDEPDAPARAITCAFAMIDEVDRWNAKRVARGASAVRIAIGVHYGAVIVGNVGSERRREFTAVGDVVNVASRLEEATRELECTMATSASCVQAAGDGVDGKRFVKTVELQLRGRQSPILVYISGTKNERHPA